MLEMVTDNGVSGTQPPLARDGLGRVLGMLSDGTADALVVAKLDRLGRSTLDVLSLADTSRRQGWHLVILDVDLDTSTAGGRMMLGMLSVLAQWERDVIAERTASALQALKRKGARLGRPVEQSDAARGRVIALRASGLSMGKTAALLNAEGVPSARGGRWHGSTVASIERSSRLDAEAIAAQGCRSLTYRLTQVRGCQAFARVRPVAVVTSSAANRLHDADQMAKAPSSRHPLGEGGEAGSLAREAAADGRTVYRVDAPRDHGEAGAGQLSAAPPPSVGHGHSFG